MKTNYVRRCVTLFSLALLTLPIAALEDEAARRGQLKKLHTAMRIFGELNAGRAPAHLSQLLDEHLIDGPADVMRPGAASVPPRAELDARADYTFEPPPDVTGMVIRERSPLSGESEVLAVFKDGTIRALPMKAPTESTPPRAAAPPAGPAVSLPPDLRRATPQARASTGGAPVDSASLPRAWPADERPASPPIPDSPAAGAAVDAPDLVVRPATPPDAEAIVREAARRRQAWARAQAHPPTASNPMPPASGSGAAVAPVIRTPSELNGTRPPSPPAVNPSSGSPAPTRRDAAAAPPAEPNGQLQVALVAGVRAWVALAQARAAREAEERNGSRRGGGAPAGKTASNLPPVDANTVPVDARQSKVSVAPDGTITFSLGGFEGRSRDGQFTTSSTPAQVQLPPGMAKEDVDTLDMLARVLARDRQQGPPVYGTTPAVESAQPGTTTTTMATTPGSRGSMIPPTLPAVAGTSHAMRQFVHGVPWHSASWSKEQARAMNEAGHKAEKAKDYAKVVGAFTDLAGWQLAQSPDNPADKLLESVAYYQERSLGLANSPELAYTRNNLGVVYTASGTYGAAENEFLKAQRIWEGLTPANTVPSEDYAVMLHNLAVLREKQGNAAEAARLAAQSEAILARRRAAGLMR